MDITSWTLEKCLFGNVKNIENLQKLSDVIVGMLLHDNHVLYRSNLRTVCFPNLTYWAPRHIVIVKGQKI
jgi:hypothetical protein